MQLRLTNRRNKIQRLRTASGIGGGQEFLKQKLRPNGEVAIRRPRTVERRPSVEGGIFLKAEKWD